MKKLNIDVKTDPNQGLATDVVVTSEKNVIENNISKSYKSIFLENTFTLFNIINLILAVLVFYTGSYKNMLFMGVVISNMAIGIIQEIRSKKVLDKLALISQQKALVIRNGKKEEIPIDEVVKNDILLVTTGNQICCDCVLVEGEIEVNESMLTGESDAVVKKPGDTVLSGTFVVSGEAKLQAVLVGESTYSYSIYKEAKRSKQFPSMLRDSINAIIRFSTVIIFPMGILLFSKQYFTSHNLNESILNTVAAVGGMIPEGLVVLTSVALAIASMQLAKKKVLVQELYCIETLARVDVLCLDKTGTITSGAMDVKNIIPFEEYSQDFIKNTLANLYSVLPDTNPTALAIRAFAGNPQGIQAEEITPFSSSRKQASALLKGVRYICGAYSYIFDKPDKKILAQIDEYAKEGYRVLALAKQENKEAPKLMALVCIEDQIRPNAKKILNFFEKQDVALKVISGDDPITVASIAQKAGITGSYIDMKGIQENEIPKIVKEYSIFGRVSPEQKKWMVQALKKDDHVVAMTGDGVNDVMALKEADCSIAMGSGSQAARSVASLVLLKDQFNAMPSILDKGRGVINNIQRTASLFLVKTLFSLGLSILTLVWLKEYPFQPIQLTLISSLCTGIPSFILTLEPDYSRVKGNFLVNVFSKALPGALNVILMVFILSIGQVLLNIPEDQISTMATILAAANALYVLISVCIPFTLLRKVLVCTMTAAMVIAVVFFSKFFMLVSLDIYQLIFTAAYIPAMYFILRFLASLPWKKIIEKYRIFNLKKA